MNQISALSLEIALVVIGVTVLLWESVAPIRDSRKLGYTLALLTALLLGWSFALKPVTAPLAHGLFRLDNFAILLKQVFLGILTLVLVQSAAFSHRLKAGASEFYVLLLLSGCGMLVTASVNDFVLLFMSLELVTISFYILTSFLRDEAASLEAGTKYLIIGGLASGVMVYGISYVVGIAGSTKFDAIAHYLATQDQPPRAFLFGLMLILAGLSFKISAVPGHIWAPDVYQGAPTPVTAYLAAGSKAAGFALILRLHSVCAPASYAGGHLLVAVLAISSFLHGNLGALSQRHLKRLMGYSSIAHAGYMLIGLAVDTPEGVAAMMFYLIQYAVSVLCIFLSLVPAMESTGTDHLASFTGLHRRSPLLAAGIAIPMVSLAGLPPFSGFFGKLLLFQSAMSHFSEHAGWIALVALACVAALVALIVYFGVVRTIYGREGIHSGEPIQVCLPVRVCIVLCLVAIIILGVAPSPIYNFVLHATTFLF